MMSLAAICDMPPGNDGAARPQLQPQQQNLSNSSTPTSGRHRSSSNSAGVMSRKCAYCDRRFSKAEHLKRHQRSHTGEKPFRCDVCKKSYARSDVLIRHHRNHHSDVPHRDSNDAATDPKAIMKSPGSTSSGSLEEDSVGMLGINSRSSMPSQARIPRMETQSSFQTNMADPSPSTLAPGSIGQMPHLTSQTSQPHPLHRMSSQHDGSCLIEAALSVGQQSRPQPPYQPLDRMTPQHPIPQQAMSQQMLPHQYHPMMQPRVFPPNPNDQQLYPIYAPPYQDLSSWLETTVDVGMQPLPYGLDIWGDSAMMDFMDLAEPMPTLLTPRPPARQKQSFSNNVPDERFQRVERLWPLRRSIHPSLIGQTLWQQVASHDQDGLFSSPALSAQHPYTMPPRRTETSRWGLGEDTRGRLIREYGSASQNDSRASQSTQSTPMPADGSTSKRSDTASDVSLGAKFPPAEVLDMSLDLYFRRFYSLWPFIHRATFDARATPTSLLLPMCLIGLELLDADGSRKFIRAYMPEALDKIRNELTARALPSCQASDLLTTLASAILVLRLAATNPVRGMEEQVHCLYSETISLAQRRGLFTAYAGQQISIELLRQGRDDDTAWKAWSRVEAAKRLIICLIMVDSFYSNILDVSPMVRIDTLGFSIPCSTDLFEAPSARRWAQAANSSNTSIITNVTTLTLDPSSLPGLDTEIALQGLLSGLWIRLAEARHRLLDPARFQFQQDGTHGSAQPRIPLASYALDSAHTIAPLLASIPMLYAPLLKICNPSTNALWHAQCMSLLADISLFELAAGREGPERAKRALEEISVWSHTPAARRACIHAAQTFLIMAGRKISDGTTFHSEIALFHGALVLGLYLFTVRGEDGNASGGASVVGHGADAGAGMDMNAGMGGSLGVAGLRDDDELFELLELVDWALISSEGMSLETVNPSGNANTTTTQQQSMQGPDNGLDSAAKRFITRGGTVSFNGAMHRGGYNSARRILLDYANLMKSVAKWNVRGYCRILRIMSDTLIEVDDMMSASE